jgi:hypothetical protein
MPELSSSGATASEERTAAARKESPAMDGTLVRLVRWCSPTAGALWWHGLRSPY